MKAFKFSLEPVLVLRLREEDAAKQSYAEALGFRNRCQDALEQAMVDLEGLQFELSSKRQGLSRRDDQILFIHAIRQQRDFCHTVTQRLTRAEQLVQARMETWMDARRKTEMLVRLKRKHQDRHDFEVQRLEERAIDDIVSARHVLTSRSLAN
ncbi:MAG: hypothetical protein WCO60_12300 [Verrucomicrobiota bacterium]